MLSASPLSWLQFITFLIAKGSLVHAEISGSICLCKPPTGSPLVSLLCHTDSHTHEKRLPLKALYSLLAAHFLRSRLSVRPTFLGNLKWLLPYFTALFQFFYIFFLLGSKTTLFLLKHSYNENIHLSTKLISNSPT